MPGVNYLRPDKALGQHFLRSSKTAARIVDAAALTPDLSVLEIGPGKGCLTKLLLASPARSVVVVEKDQRLLPYLRKIQATYPEKLTILTGDALLVDPQLPRPGKVVANLPYNIATALILRWLQAPEQYLSYTLTVQKEVATRLTAPPRTKDYGRLSVITQWLCQTQLHFDLEPALFTPQPKVTSTVITLTPRINPDPRADFASLTYILKQAFHQRRKILSGTLKKLFGDHAGQVKEKLSLRDTTRAEELDIPTWCQLAELYRRQTTCR